MKKSIISIMVLLFVLLSVTSSAAPAYAFTAIPCTKENNCLVKKDHKVKEDKDPKICQGHAKDSDSHKDDQDDDIIYDNITIVEKTKHHKHCDQESITISVSPKPLAGSWSSNQTLKFTNYLIDGSKLTEDVSITQFPTTLAVLAGDAGILRGCSLTNNNLAPNFPNILTSIVQASGTAPYVFTFKQPLTMTKSATTTLTLWCKIGQSNITKHSLYQWGITNTQISSIVAEHMQNGDIVQVLGNTSYGSVATIVSPL